MGFLDTSIVGFDVNHDGKRDFRDDALMLHILEQEEESNKRHSSANKAKNVYIADETKSEVKIVEEKPVIKERITKPIPPIDRLDSADKFFLYLGGGVAIMYLLGFMFGILKDDVGLGVFAICLGSAFVLLAFYDHTKKYNIAMEKYNNRLRKYYEQMKELENNEDEKE